MKKSKRRRLFFLLTLILFSCSKDNPTAQFANEVASIDQYLSSTGVPYIKHESGIRIVIHTYGDGPPPHSGQTLTMPLTGKLFSGNSVFTNVIFNDKLENLNTKGLKIAMPYLLEGTVATIYVPSLYAYGTTGTTGVPENATLVYEITLASITRTPAEQLQFDIDTAAIHNYVKDSATNAIRHRSGIWYIMDTVGTGDFPTVYDSVGFHMRDTTFAGVFSRKDSILLYQNIFNQIDGIKIALPMMREKGKATFYMPSGLTYNGNTDGNSSTVSLKFVVRLDTLF